MTAQPTDSTSALAPLVIDRLETLGVPVVDGTLITNPPGPYLVFRAGIGVRTQARYCDRKSRLRWTYSVLVVNNSANGARLLADRVRDLLDEVHLAPETYSVEDYTSDLIRDDEVEGAFAYSIAIYFKAHPPRRQP